MPQHRFLLALLLTSLLLSGGLLLRGVHHLDRVMLRAAREAGIDPEVLSAVAWKETRYNSDAIGGAGEIGMFQIMPGTASDWAKAHGEEEPDADALREPALNARIAAWYLRAGLDAYAMKDAPLPYSLARYNAGPTKAAEWAKDGDTAEAFIESIGFPGTRQYVQDILNRMQ